jgi:hypothetical protein
MDSYPAHRWINTIEYLKDRIKIHYTTDESGLFPV